MEAGIGTYKGTKKRLFKLTCFKSDYELHLPLILTLTRVSCIKNEMFLRRDSNRSYALGFS